MESQISQKLKQLRLKGGFSQEELANQAGVSLRTVQRFENSETIPRGDTIRRLFQIFGKTPDEVLDWSMEENAGFLSTLAISGLFFLLSPILGILVPLILWLNRRGKIVGVDELGKKMINFQITMGIPYFLIRGIWLFKVLPILNDGVVISGLDMYQISIYVNGLCFGLVILFCVWNAIALYRGRKPCFPLAIPFIR